MTELLHSRFAIWVCLLILVGWIFTLLAVFWPGLGNTKADMRKKDDGNVCL